MTAIEFLEKGMEESGLLLDHKWLVNLIEQAKEMEKRQIVDAVKWYMNTEGIINQDELAEDYYNETFKNQLQG